MPSGRKLASFNDASPGPACIIQRPHLGACARILSRVVVSGSSDRRRIKKKNFVNLWTQDWMQHTEWPHISPTAPFNRQASQNGESSRKMDAKQRLTWVHEPGSQVVFGCRTAPIDVEGAGPQADLCGVEEGVVFE